MKARPLRIDGLRGRLTAWVAGVLIVSVAIIFYVVYNETGTRLLNEIDRDLRGDATQLAHALAMPRPRDTAQMLATADGYMRAQPYSRASTLLLVIVPGAGAASNHPELLGYNRSDHGETLTVQSQENALARHLLTAHPGYSTAVLPDVGEVRLFETSVPGATNGAFVGAGEALATVSRAQAGVARSFALAGAIALALALIASYLVGRRVSAPLRRLAGLAARVDAGDLRHRADVDVSSTHEVRVLAEAFNHMLDRLAEAFTAQREFVADASHELRTPLTVMRGQLELLIAEESPSREEVVRVERLVQTEISRITRVVEDLLLLAQSDRSDFLRPRPFDLTVFIHELWDGLSLTADRDFQLGDVPAGVLMADPDRLAQALRNLTRNAIEHTTEGHGLVRLEVDRVGSDSVRFSVVDDGPGIPPDERERVFERFHRTDPARTRSAGGAGLGLSIVRAIADAHHGFARARQSTHGGARVELELPGLTVPGGLSAPHRVVDLPVPK